jgi:3D (Asp-Asp-Asp) domain-containing protein
MTAELISRLRAFFDGRARQATAQIFRRYRPLCIIVAVLLAIVFAWETYLHLKFRTTLFVDGNRRTVMAQPQTVEKLLQEQHITVGGKDVVAPPLSAAAPRGGVIRIIRVSEKTITESRFFPFKILTRKRMHENLRDVEIQKGILRKLIREVKILYQDGVEKSREVLKEREIKKTHYRLVLLDKDDYIESIYDLSQTKKMNMIATAYYPGDPLCWQDGTQTCLGQKMQRGIIAVDPHVIPLHTRVYVPGYGYGYAGDTGSAIKNRRIDLGVNDQQEEKPWMHKPVTVYILEKANKW